MIDVEKIKNDENIVYKARKSLFIFAVPTMLSILLYAINNYLIIVGILLYLITIVSYFSVYLYITNYRLIGNVGIINITKINCTLDQIDSVHIKQNILGRIFHYGNIEITTHNNKIKFTDIKNPDYFLNKLYNNI